MTNTFQNSSFIGSVFFKVMCLVAIVAVVLTIVGIRSTWTASDIGTQILASNLTEATAAQSGGAIRFNKPEDVIAQLENTFSASKGMAVSAVVIGMNGDVIASHGEPGSHSALETLAVQALAESAQVVSTNGLSVAVPAVFGPQGTLVGVVAMQWTSETIMSQVRGQFVLSGIVFSIMLALAGLAVRQTVSKPVSAVAGAIARVEAGDLETEIPELSRSGEVGSLANALDSLRRHLGDAQKATQVGIIKGGGFEASSAAMMLANEDMKITFINPAYRRLMEANIEKMQEVYPWFDIDGVIGQSIDSFHKTPMNNRSSLESNTAWPLRLEFRVADVVLSVTISRIAGDDGAPQGYVVEWADITEQQKTTAILSALESQQVRIEFDLDWNVAFANTLLHDSAQLGETEISGKPFEEFLSGASEDTAKAKATAEQGNVVFGKFRLAVSKDNERMLDAALCPIKASDGKVASFVLLGLDITEAEAKIDAMNAAREKLESAQRKVVDSLREALSKLSEGDLSNTIEDTFSADYEQLRKDFNAAVKRLDEAMGSVAINTSTIRNEADTIATAAEDLSRRTERQASTLEQTAAAVAQLTASVASAAEGARQANDVVTSARGNAEQSGTVVREAVTAMSEIEQSSDQISKIISVIDDIAFQTNLLALNAGVEAARAGDAGRGFAVVASEVRALAQRSSDAAREINELISRSSGHVKRGVELVAKTGSALEEIVASVTNISGLVSNISASAQEQSTGLEEINNAMSQLDQVTQQNAAMFEETSAASQTLNNEASAMSETMQLFRLSGGHQPTMPKPVSNVTRSNPKDVISENPLKQPFASGNLAIAPASLDDDDDWEDF